MILIMSSAYLSAEFQVELGAIPPTLLPLGNKKLLEHQVTSLRSRYLDEEIVVSLPESFQITESFQKTIDRLGITIILVPDQFSLSESVLYVLNVSSSDDHRPITILYGDTYISEYSFLDGAEDAIAVAQAKNSYNWEYIGSEHISTYDENLVWCGFFVFSNKRLLLKSLAICRDSFNDAVKYYKSLQNMTYCKTEYWQDLGHVNTYFAARANLTTQRAFNDLRIEEGIVVKSGSPQLKIEAEARWFESIPNDLRIFSPLYLGQRKIDGNIGYAIEYLPCMPLNELFVHGQNQVQDWSIIFSEIKRWFNLASNQLSINNKEIESEFEKLIDEKTFSRIKQYAKEQNISLDTSCFYGGKQLPSIRQICIECIDKVKQLSSVQGVLHGDLCFSNMLFDSRSLKLKVIDPRGLDVNQNFTIYGDLKYDYAKLTHSVIGLYDFIISGDFIILQRDTKDVSLHFDIDDRIKEIQQVFIKRQFIENISFKNILPLVILLFLSMLPLHNDRPDRQEAMFLNALRLYQTPYN